LQVPSDESEKNAADQGTASKKYTRFQGLDVVRPAQTVTKRESSQRAGNGKHRDRRECQGMQPP